MSENVDTSPKLRNARACESCRASKAKCVYKTEQKICLRCFENGNECIVRLKARPMRTKAARLPNATNGQFSGSGDPEYVLDLPTIPSPDVQGDILALREHHQPFFGNDNYSGDPLSKATSEALTQGSTSQPLIPQRKITLHQAEKMLSSFKEKTNYFPFVQIPQDQTVPSLSRSAPFLLLAILCSASMADPALHHQLDYEFRRVLSMKVVMEGQKSLEYLQGMLVYIAWYPIHTRPRNTQTFTYVNLAISIAVDLGLDQDIPKSSGFNTNNSQGLAEGGHFTSAAKRAYLGCYFLSSLLSMGFQKPNTLKYRNLMDAHGEELLSEESSPEIYSLVRLQRLCERIVEFHSLKEPGNEIHAQSLTAELATQAFEQDLDDWREMTPDFLRGTELFGLFERSVTISVYSHRLGFLRRPYKNVLESANKQPAGEPPLLNCLDACKKFFEYLLSLPEISMTKYSIIQWAQITQVILVLSRLTFLLAADLGWDAETTRGNVPLVMYLDCLCFRCQKLSGTLEKGDELPKHPDLLFILKMILESLKRSYEKRVSEINAKTFNHDHRTTSGKVRTHCPIRDPSLNVYFEDQYFSASEPFETSGISTASFPAPFHDIWATMTGSWVQE